MANTKHKMWHGNLPKSCDMCSRPIHEVKFFVDGKTKLGPFGIMCPACFPKIGVGLGQGKGQKYSTKEPYRKLEG